MTNETSKPKRTRGTSELGPGEACDKILELEIALPVQIAKAQEELTVAFQAAVRRVYARVPADLRHRCADMLKGAGWSWSFGLDRSDETTEEPVSDKGSSGNERSNTEAEQGSANAEPASASVEAGTTSDESGLSARLREPIPEKPPGSVIAIDERPARVRGAR